MRRLRLALLIEWGQNRQTEMVESALQALQDSEESGGLVTLVPKAAQQAVPPLLHLALVRNQAGIAAAGLRRGASLYWYYPANKACDSDRA